MGRAAKAEQPDLFGGDEPRRRLEIERRAALREEPAYRAGLTQRGAPKTSIKAARTVMRRQNTIRAEVEEFALGRGATGFIDEDLREHFGVNVPESSYRKRRTELAQDGYILDSGTTRKNRMGQSVTIWVHRNFAGDKAKPVEPAHRRTGKLRAAVEKAAATFRHYEQLHRAKGTLDGDAKAYANAALAAEMEGALQ